MKRVVAGLSAILAMIFLARLPLWAQDGGTATVRGLGTLTFPVSTSVPAARQTFLRGVLLLHLFEYSQAAAAFRQAERQDPSFAMAYWGEAMTANHPVWNQQDVDAGRTALLQLGRTPEQRQARAPTARERAYLAAAEILYGIGPKARRDTLYSNAMGRLLLAHPADDEARLFYALSLLGLSQGERSVPTYLHAAAIAESVFVRHPRHPGASHYFIHAVDDPDHAARGIAAARALARTAPDADHAQHMTSHIFVALGRWDDVVAANETALAVADAALHRRNRPPVYCGHYDVWLDYGYVQQGRLADATNLLAHCRDEAARVPTDTADANPIAYSFLTMWSDYLIASGDWSGSVAHWTIVPDAGLGSRLVYWFTEGLGAARRGEFAAARTALDELARVQRDIEAWAGGSTENLELERARVLRGEVEGLIAAGQGNVDGGIARLREATLVEDSMAYAFGPPLVNQPSHELLGAELLRLQKYRDAEAQYRIALRRTPRRTLALLGLARAARALDDSALSYQTYKELVSIWRNADQGQDDVAEAKAYLHRKAR